MTWYRLLTHTRNGGALVGHTDNGLVGDNDVIYLGPKRLEEAKVQEKDNITLIGL